MFSRGGGEGGTPCHTQGTIYIVRFTSMLCFTKSEMSNEHERATSLQKVHNIELHDEGLNM